MWRRPLWGIALWNQPTRSEPLPAPVPGSRRAEDAAGRVGEAAESAGPRPTGHFLVRLARSWLVYLGASLDRDFASPGLLGVREDGPAGGGTFRDPVAEPRPGSRSRAYVSGPSAGGRPKVAPMIQVGRCPV